MKNIIVKNYHDVQPLVQSANGNSFAVKPVIEDVDKCSANFVEVAPGNFAYGYHYHEENEEVFYIISGTAAVKTETGEIRLKAGDAICFRPISAVLTLSVMIRLMKNWFTLTLGRQTNRTSFILPAPAAV